MFDFFLLCLVKLSVRFRDDVINIYRWKGENVATSEVADILNVANGILEANVYGVKVEGKSKDFRIIEKEYSCKLIFNYIVFVSYENV